MQKGNPIPLTPPLRNKIQNKDLSCDSKKVVYIIEYSRCKEIYIGSTQALKTKISLHRSNIKIAEKRKLNVSKHLYGSSLGEFEIMPKYQTKDYMLLQIKKKKFIDRFKPKLNKAWIIQTHKWTQYVLWRKQQAENKHVCKNTIYK